MEAELIHQRTQFQMSPPGILLRGNYRTLTGKIWQSPAFFKPSGQKVSWQYSLCKGRTHTDSTGATDLFHRNLKYDFFSHFFKHIVNRANAKLSFPYRVKFPAKNLFEFSCCTFHRSKNVLKVKSHKPGTCFQGFKGAATFAVHLVCRCHHICPAVAT